MFRILALALAVLSLCSADEAAARCSTHHRYGCASTWRRASGSGRVLSPTLAPQRATRQAPITLPDMPDRPVQPGYAPLPAYLPNNAPPSFAPQPIK